MFRAMQASSSTLPREDGVIEGVEAADPSVFLTADIWCKTIATLAQVRCEKTCEAPERNPTLV